MSSTPHATAPRSRTGQSGFTIVEVLVAALILAIAAAGIALAFTGAIDNSGIARNRAAAQSLAQQNESRLRGYTVGQLANLDQTLSAVTVGGTSYTVHQTATFVSDSAGAPSCAGNASADYLKTTSTVTWPNRPASVPPVTVTGVITPTFGEISASSGVLAVSVLDSSPNPIAGMPVSVSQVGGSGSASGVTASNGCVLFGDLPTGSYTVTVTPPSGTYVDATTGQAVTSTAPDVVNNVVVSAGTTASSTKQFQLGTPGGASFSFTNLFPGSISSSAAATSPSVVLAASGLTGSGYVVCSAQDTGGCPAVANPDTSWNLPAWSTTGTPAGSFTASPLYPYTYRTYAGLCSSDDPGSDPQVTVTPGVASTTPTNLKLPALVVRLWSGTGTAASTTSTSKPSASAGSEGPLLAGSKLVVTDTGCGEHFVGGPGVVVPTGDSYLPLASNPKVDTSNSDTGLLGYPGMPYGGYAVCYQNTVNNVTKDVTVSLTNQGSGEVINLFTQNLAAGSCAV